MLWRSPHDGGQVAVLLADDPGAVAEGLQRLPAAPPAVPRRPARPARRVGGVGRPRRTADRCSGSWRRARSTTTSSDPGTRPTSTSTARSPSSSSSGSAAGRPTPARGHGRGRPRTPRAHEVRRLLARNGVPTRSLERSSPEAGPRSLSRRRPRPGGRSTAAGAAARRAGPRRPQRTPSWRWPTALHRARHRGRRRGRRRRSSAPARPGSRPRSTRRRRGCRTLVVERESIGGQAGSSSLIRNYLGFSRGVSGAELAQRAYQQAWVFGSPVRSSCGRPWRCGPRATGVRPRRRRPRARSSPGRSCWRRASPTAASACRSWRRCPVAGVFYGASVSEARAAGAARTSSSSAAATPPARPRCTSPATRASVTLLVRGASLAASMSQYLIDELEAVGRRRPAASRGRRAAAGPGGWRGSSSATATTGAEERPTGAGLFVLIGAAPAHRSGCPTACCATRGATCSPAPTCSTRAAAGRGRSSGRRARSRPRCRASSRSATCGGSVKRVASAVGEGVGRWSPRCTTGSVNVRGSATRLPLGPASRARR